MSDCQQNSPCCNDVPRSSLPDELEATISFSGTTASGCVLSDKVVLLKRRCQPVPIYIQTFSEFDDLTEETREISVVVKAEYISKKIIFDCGLSALVAIAQGTRVPLSR